MQRPRGGSDTLCINITFAPARHCVHEQSGLTLRENAGVSCYGGSRGVLLLRDALLRARRLGSNCALVYVIAVVALAAKWRDHASHKPRSNLQCGNALLPFLGRWRDL